MKPWNTRWVHPEFLCSFETGSVCETATTEHGIYTTEASTANQYIGSCHMRIVVLDVPFELYLRAVYGVKSGGGENTTLVRGFWRENRGLST